MRQKCEAKETGGRTGANHPCGASCNTRVRILRADGSIFGTWFWCCRACVAELSHEISPWKLEVVTPGEA